MDAGVPLSIPHDIGAGFDAGPASIVFLIAVVPLLGRIFLAWFPAGLPGRHAPRDLPLTWAASHLVGMTWLLALRELGLDATWPYFAFGVPVIALIARVVTSPAGLVPRHEPVPLRASATACAVIVAAVLATGWLTARAVGTGTSLLFVPSVCAAVILAHEALVLARVQPWLRAAAVVAVAAAIALLPYREGRLEAFATLGACAIAAGLVGWIRRGDGRALAIASVGVAFLILSRSGMSAAGIVLFVPIVAVIGTAKPSRLRALAWLAGSLVASTVVLHTGGRVVPHTAISRTPFAAGVELALLALVVCVPVATYMLRIRRETPSWNPSGAPESREARVLGFTALIAIVSTRLVSCRLSDSLEDSSYPIHSPASASCWILLVIAVAIPLARTFDRARTA